MACRRFYPPVSHGDRTTPTSGRFVLRIRMIDPIAENLLRVQDRIANAAIAAGRRPQDITLVAVSKTKPVEAVAAALAAGQTVFGENRIQEAAAKFPALREKFSLSLHIIGGLQTNKARDAVRIADVI